MIHDVPKKYNPKRPFVANDNRFMTRFLEGEGEGAIRGEPPKSPSLIRLSL